MDGTDELWIFGYGSLIWRPGFAYAERCAAQVSGFARVFWQGSTDHRGAPGAPGRVVTLTEAPGARCSGVAYRLAAESRAQILEALDHRERGGYVRLPLELELAGPQPRRARGLTYVALPGNANYLGPSPLAEIAAQIRRCAGPSGSNLEYALRLAAALRELDAVDPEVLALEALLLAGESVAGSTSAGSAPAASPPVAASAASGLPRPQR